MIKRRTVIMGIGGAVLLAAIGWGLGTGRGPTGGAPQQTVKIGITPFQDTVLPVVGERLGLYKQDGYGVQFVDVNWTEVSVGLASGAFDVVLFPIDSMQSSWPALKTAGKELIYYAPLYAFNGAAIMVNSKDGFQTLSSLEGLSTSEVKQRTRTVMEQMRGKKIGITEGTIAEKVVLDALSTAGMSKADVQLFNARYEDNLAAFLAGRIDAFVGGVTERVKARQGGAVELLIGSAVSDPGIVGWVTTKTFADKHPATMKSLTDNFFKIARHMTEDPKGRATLATSYLKGKASVDYTPEEYAYALAFQYFPRTREDAVRTFLRSDSPYYWKGIWDRSNAFLLKTGKINAPVPIDAFLGETQLPRQ